MLDVELIDRLRADLTTAAFTGEVVQAALGPVAAAALHREEALPAILATRGHPSPAVVLAAVMMLGQSVPRRVVAAALPTLGVEGAERLGLVTAAGAGPDDEVRSLVDLRPYAAADAAGDVTWWVASDHGELVTGGPLRQDHVLGIGGAATTLAQFTVRAPVGRALDLGTGSGIQTLHASRHARHVVATDLSERALAFAAFNSELAGITAAVELQRGDLFAPVVDEQFDLVVSNPPFVITPAHGPMHEYRSAGRVGDGVMAELFTGVAAQLTPGGVAQFLGNWEHPAGRDWASRVQRWIEASGLDGWVVQRDVQDPAEYAETWLRDAGEPAGPRRDAAYQGWLADFTSRDVEAIGFGLVTLRRPLDESAPRLRRVEEVTGEVRQPLGPHVAALLAAHDRLTSLADAELLNCRLRVAADVTEERHLTPGADHPSAVLVRQGGGMGRAVRASTALAGFVGACDGELTAGQLIGGLAALLEVPTAGLSGELLPQLRSLLLDGQLVFHTP